MTLKVNYPHFQYKLRGSQDEYLFANFVILAQIHHKVSWRQAEFPWILRQMAKMTLKVKVNDPI